MDAKNREKMLLIGVGAVVALWVLDIVVIDPVTQAYKDRQAAIQKLKEEIAHGNSIHGNKSAIEAKWDTMRTNTLPDNSTLAENKLYASFLGWEQAAGVTVVRQQPTMTDPPDQDAPYKNEEFHVDMTGSLDQLFNFLYKMESSPLGLKVDSVELTSRDDSGRQLALGLTVSGLILLPTTNSVPQ